MEKSAREAAQNIKLLVTPSCPQMDNTSFNSLQELQQLTTSLKNQLQEDELCEEFRSASLKSHQVTDLEKISQLEGENQDLKQEKEGTHRQTQRREGDKLTVQL